MTEPGLPQTIQYRHPRGVRVVEGERPLVSTAEGGLVALDEPLLALWRAAPAASERELESDPVLAAPLSGILAESLACLAEAGLLTRVGPASPERPALRAITGPLVSAIVVLTTPREIEWLPRCLESIAAQQYTPLEILLVDNASGAAIDATNTGGVPVRTITLGRRVCFARALNAGAREAAGDYLLFLNCDAMLLPGALAALMERAGGERVAAVAPKTRYWRAPGFLNGIGNRVRLLDWGTDNAIGHLDLGQFDELETVPSVSLTVALIARRAMVDVGLFDEAFPAYYEDTEWSYRARVCGWRIAAAPRADALHAFGGGFWETGAKGGLTPLKMRNAAIGRLRFAALIPDWKRAVWMIRCHLIEDALNVKLALRLGEYGRIVMYLEAWLKALSSPRLLVARWRIQRRSVVTRGDLFPDESLMPPCLVWQNLPVLTVDIVRNVYAPLIRQGLTRPLAEVSLQSG